MVRKMKISFHSDGNKIDFHMKSFALSLAFVMKFKATPKWPIIKMISPFTRPSPYRF